MAMRTTIHRGHNTGVGPRVSYVIPTRDRPDRLARTLDAIGSLGAHDAEVIVVDNASSSRPIVPARLAGDIPVRLLEMGSNLGAAARNEGAKASDPSSAWIVMLDDDSYPVDLGMLEALRDATGDTLAVSADIWLPAHDRRESGGLPEVFIGCGVALRRDWLLASGGYDATFGYYVEEYDLAARLIASGGRVVFDPRFAVAHHKVEQGRDMDQILRRLVRNNGWVAQRYAPDDERRREIREVRSRYRRIAEKEGALSGYSKGLVELRATIAGQMRAPLTRAHFDRFTGLAAARDALAREHARRAFATCAIIEPGKNAWAIERALLEIGVRITNADDADALILGTMSPGPMLDGIVRAMDGALGGALGIGRRVIAPWIVGQADDAPWLLRWRRDPLAGSDAAPPMRAQDRARVSA